MKLTLLLIVAAVCVFSASNAMPLKQTFETQAEIEKKSKGKKKAPPRKHRVGRPLTAICSKCSITMENSPEVPSHLFRDSFNMDDLLLRMDAEETSIPGGPKDIINKLKAIIKHIKDIVDTIVNHYVIPSIMNQICQVCNLIDVVPPIPPLPTALPTRVPFPSLPPFPVPTFPPPIQIQTFPPAPF